MKFTELQPFAAMSHEFAGAFELNFNCPGCGARTVIHVWQKPPLASVPGPTIWRFVGRIEDFATITIEPSIKDVPHSKRSTCTHRHFSVIDGEVRRE